MSGGYKYRTIMVIDDGPIDRLIVENMAKRNMFAEHIIKMESGEAAIDYLGSHPDELPHIIFMDMHLQGKKSFSFLEDYDRLPAQLKRKCIILLTSSLSDSDINHALASPYVIKYISKPISSEILSKL